MGLEAKRHVYVVTSCLGLGLAESPSGQRNQGICEVLRVRHGRHLGANGDRGWA